MLWGVWYHYLFEAKPRTDGDITTSLIIVLYVINPRYITPLITVGYITLNTCQEGYMYRVQPGTKYLFIVWVYSINYFMDKHW